MTPPDEGVTLRKSYRTSHYSGMHIAQHNLPLAYEVTVQIQPDNVEFYSVVEAYANGDVLMEAMTSIPLYREKA